MACHAQLWSYMFFCTYLRRSDERDMSSFEADVWAEINDTANPTFKWLAFDLVRGRNDEDMDGVDPLVGGEACRGGHSTAPSEMQQQSDHSLPLVALLACTGTGPG